MPVSRPKILLVYPFGGDVGMLGDHPFYKLVGMVPHMPPLGLMTVAGYLPRDWEIRLVDENVEPLDDATILWADYVFLSGMYPHKTGLCRVAERASTMGKHVIAGGPFVTGSKDKVRGRYGIKTLCLNECEPYIDELVRDIEAGTVKDIYGEAGERPDMKSVKVPRFDLKLNLARYAMTSMQVSRGCPFDCEFCDVPSLVGRKMRYKSAEQVVAELDALHAQVKQGQVFICDDNLTGHLIKSREVLAAMAEWNKKNGYPFAFLTQLSLNVADEKEVLDLLFEANVRTVITGIESVNEASLVEAGKNHNLRRSIPDRVEDMLRAGIEVYAYLVVGFDNDPPTIFRDQLAFVERAKLTYAETSMLVAMDNTGLGQRMEREGRLLYNTANDASEVMENYRVGMTNFVTKLPPRTLQEGYAGLLEQLLEPESWYARTRRMVEMLPDRDRHHHSISLKLRPDTLFIVFCTLLYLPGRLTMLKHALALARSGSMWRVWRYFLSIFAVGLTRPEYLRKSRRIRDFLRQNPESDPTRGRPITPRLAAPVPTLRVIQ